MSQSNTPVSQQESQSQQESASDTDTEAEPEPPKAQRRIASQVGHTRTSIECALDGCDGVYLQSQADSERVCHVCGHSPDREERRRRSTGKSSMQMFAAARWVAFWDERRAIRTDGSRDERPYCVGGFKGAYE